MNNSVIKTIPQILKDNICTVFNLLNLFAIEEEQSVFRLIKGIRAERRTRKRLVVNQRRYEGACDRIADVNVTFCDRGAAADMAPHKTQATGSICTESTKARKKVVATVSRCKRVYKRTGEPSVPFCERGGAICIPAYKRYLRRKAHSQKVGSEPKAL